MNKRTGKQLVVLMVIISIPLVIYHYPTLSLPIYFEPPPALSIQSLTLLSCHEEHYKRLVWVKLYHYEDWVPTTTLNEILCHIMTFKPKLRDVLYTSRCDKPFPPVFNTTWNSTGNITFHFNSEHTLAVGEGRAGPLPWIYNKNGTNLTYGVYLNYHQPMVKDRCVVVDYSESNIKHMILSNHFSSDFLERVVYIPPFYYPFINITRKPRQINLLTTFGNPNAAGRRRSRFLEKAHEIGIKIDNRNSLDLDKLMELYDNTKILINMHQSDGRNTFEELRCLPALRRKVVVVSEISPLQETIPYHEYVIWAPLDDLARVANETLANYDKIYDQFFGPNSKFPEICSAMTNKALNEITTLIHKVTNLSPE